MNKLIIQKIYNFYLAYYTCINTIIILTYILLWHTVLIPNIVFAEEQAIVNNNKLYILFGTACIFVIGGFAYYMLLSNDVTTDIIPGVTSDIISSVTSATLVPSVTSATLVATLPLLQPKTPSAVSETTVLSNITSQVDHMAIYNSFKHALKDVNDLKQTKQNCFDFMQKSFPSHLFAATDLELKQIDSPINNFQDTLNKILSESEETNKADIMNYVFLTTSIASYNSIYVAIGNVNFEAFERIFDLSFQTNLERFV